MRRVPHVVTAVAVASLALAGCGDEPPYQNLSVAKSTASHSRPTGEETAVGVALVNELAGELYPAFARSSGEGGLGNVVFSPPALAGALGRLHAGAQGASAEELRELLGPVPGEVGLDRAINGAIEPLRDANGPERDASGADTRVDLEVGSELFGQSGIDWEDDYLDALVEAYDAELPSVDFEDAPDHGLAELNARVADASAGLVTSLVPEGAVDADTRLVGTAATGLAAPWFTPLTPQQPAPFTRADGSEVEVPMVGGVLTSRYILADDWQSVTLPFAGQDLALTLVVPDEGKLGVVQDDLAGVLAEATADGQKVAVAVSFPAFTVTNELDVPAALARLGVEAPFGDAGTDFEPMTTEQPLRVDDLFHEATLHVDASGALSRTPEEDGAPEASEAATTEGLRVDRTFLFVVHQVVTGTPIFLGRVTDPTA